MGYGQLSVNGKLNLAHRFSYELAYGPIPNGLLVCHHCDNPRCVRPDHLFLGDHSANTVDMMSKGRWHGPNAQKTHCPYGHPYDSENTAVFTRKNGSKGRQCKACDTRRSAERRERRRKLLGIPLEVTERARIGARALLAKRHAAALKKQWEGKP